MWVILKTVLSCTADVSEGTEILWDEKISMKVNHNPTRKKAQQATTVWKSF